MIIKEMIRPLVSERVVKLIKKAFYRPYPIVLNPNEAFERVYKIKDASWEDTYYPECYGHCKEQHLQVYIPAEYIYKTANGVVSAESDVVLTEKGVYWEKFNTEEFVTWAIPADNNVAWYDFSNIGIKRFKEKEFIPGRTLSLIGTWAYHWGHCMYQFMPKLFSAGEAGLLDEPITVLVVENEDATIMEIIRKYLTKYPNAKLVFARNKVEYTCEELYFAPTPGSSFNGPKFRLDYPYFISRHVLDKTKKYIIDPLIAKVKDNETKYEKLFLPRGGRKRTLINYDEVHDYFMDMGFKDIEGSELTLEEKADLFYHAKEVVCLYGSSVLNMMFCNQANSMIMLNYRMATDTSLYLQIRDYVKTCINVTGQDDSSDYHASYYIPLEKIKKVYEEYIKA